MGGDSGDPAAGLRGPLGGLGSGLMSLPASPLSVPLHVKLCLRPPARPSLLMHLSVHLSRSSGSLQTLPSQKHRPGLQRLDSPSEDGVFLRRSSELPGLP